MSMEKNKIPLIDLIKYLQSEGWKISEYANDKFILFQGPLNDFGKPLEITIPRNENYQDYNDRVQDALRVVSLLNDKSIDSVKKSINHISHDIFKVRITDTGAYSNSIPLSYAYNSLKSIKDLFVYGASSEQVSLPFFTAPLQVGINHAHSCRFGHTFEGSFGLAISSPIISDYVQVDLFEEQQALPFERKVMERIIRGLDLLEASVQNEDANILINGYDIGFNSKMCEAFLELSGNKLIDIGIDIEWSTKFEVSEDIKNKNNWMLTRSSYEVLEYAAEELNKIEPFYEIIVGNIITLHSNKNPMSNEDFLRQATIRHRMYGKKILVKLDLDKKGYAIAYEAHGRGLPVQVKGKLYKKGNSWKMFEVEEIKLL